MDNRSNLNLGNNNPNINGAASASSDPQLSALRAKVDDSAYASTSRDRMNAFSVTNDKMQPQINVGGSATAMGGLQDTTMVFEANDEPEPILEPVVEAPLPPAPAPIPEPIQPERRPAPVTPPPAPVPEPEPQPEQFVKVVQPQAQPQPAPRPMPQPTAFAAVDDSKNKKSLSAPLMIIIAIAVLALIGGGIFAFVAMSNKGVNEPTPAPAPTPAPEPEPQITTENISYEEYNRRIEAREAINCTATFKRAQYTDSSYSGDYEKFSEKSWAIAADEGWNKVYISNFEFSENESADSIVKSYDLVRKPASVYLNDQDAYIWSVTKTVRAGGDGSQKYRLWSGESEAPSLKLSRSQVESALPGDFYEKLKVSTEEFQSESNGEVTFVCKNIDISEYEEFLNERTSEINN